MEGLENLRSLNLAGNHIDSCEEFSKLKNLDSLRQLTLTNSKMNASNPICQQKAGRDYKWEISRVLPQLEIIDGESFKHSSKSLYKSLDETVRQSIHEASFIKRDFDAEQCGEKWLNLEEEDEADSCRRWVSLTDDREKFYSKFFFIFQK